MASLNPEVAQKSAVVWKTFDVKIAKHRNFKLDSTMPFDSPIERLQSQGCAFGGKLLVQPQDTKFKKVKCFICDRGRHDNKLLTIS
jgi:hypothetical protein